MPIANISRYSDPIAYQLIDELLEEWQNPDQNKSQPVIVYDKEQWPAHITGVFVIWDKWGDLNQQERAHVIIDAHSRH